MAIDINKDLEEFNEKKFKIPGETELISANELNTSAKNGDKKAKKFISDFKKAAEKTEIEASVKEMITYRENLISTGDTKKAGGFFKLLIGAFKKGWDDEKVKRAEEQRTKKIIEDSKKGWPKLLA